MLNSHSIVGLFQNGLFSKIAMVPNDSDAPFLARRGGAERHEKRENGADGAFRNTAIVGLIWAIIGVPIVATASFTVSPIVYNVGTNGVYASDISGLTLQKEEILVDATGTSLTDVFFVFSGSGFQNREGSYFANTRIASDRPSQSDLGLTRFAVGSGQKLYYQLFSSPLTDSVLLDIDAPLTPLNVLKATLNTTNGSQANVPFYIQIQPNQTIFPGSYEDKLLVRMYAGTPEQHHELPLFDALLPIRIIVPMLVSTQLSHPAVTWTPSEFSLGVSKSIDISSDSNVSVNVAVESSADTDPKFDITITKYRDRPLFRVQLLPKSVTPSESSPADRLDAKGYKRTYATEIRNL
ncbi:hypothetical protein EB093_05180 [bacterium]|nr:hypothetical protein [bacterium]